MQRPPAPPLPLIVLALLIAGCSSSDARLVELSRESLERQAEQNTQTARQSEQTAEAARRLVEADAQARREMVRLQQQVQAERASLDRQREALEAERREQAQARRWDSLFAHALLSAALLLAAALPLVLCAHLVRHLGRGGDETAVGELLIGELTAERPTLLPAAWSRLPALEDPPDAPDAVPTSLPAPAAPLAEPQERAESVLVVVDSADDAEFLRRISALLHARDPELPGLGDWEASGRLVFEAAGGDDLRQPARRPATPGAAEFHLYGRGILALAEERREAADEVTRRPGCLAVVTGKRALENYLHPAAVEEALGIRVEFLNDEDVPELAARQTLAARGGPAWDELPGRVRRRLRDRARRRLSTAAAERMTPERLAERDPQGEIAGWLAAIRRLADRPHRWREEAA